MQTRSYVDRRTEPRVGPAAGLIGGEGLFATPSRLVFYLASGIEVIRPGECAQKEGHGGTINR